VAVESHVCVTIADVNSQVVEGDRHVMLIGMDTGTTCSLARVSGGEGIALWGHSLVWHDDYVYTCDGTMFRIALPGGALEDSGVPCEAVSGDGADLVVLDDAIDEQLFRYPDWDAFVAGTPSQIHPLDLVGNYSRMHIDANDVYMAWHSTDTMDVYDLPGGGFLRTIALEGHDGWINGIAVLEHTTLVLVDPSVDRLSLFDPLTGASTGSLWPAADLYKLNGLACR
jgi:hypothetical protein